MREDHIIVNLVRVRSCVLDEIKWCQRTFGVKCMHVARMVRVCETQW